MIYKILCKIYDILMPTIDYYSKPCLDEIWKSLEGVEK